MQTLPPKLYHYCTLNQHTLRNIKEGTIYLGKPANFNDPFDTLHQLKYESQPSDVFEFIRISDNVNEDNKALFRRLYEGGITAEELVLLVVLNSGEFLIRLLQKNGLTVESLCSQIISGRIDSHPCETDLILTKNLLDQRLLELYIESIKISRDTVVKESGLFCLTEESKDFLMWSYYASGHRGLCLGFSTDKLPFCKAMKVKYVSEIPILRISDVLPSNPDGQANFVTFLLATKSDKWSREREWRLFDRVGNAKVKYAPSQLTELYFGASIDHTDKEIVLKLLQDNNAVKCFQLRKTDNFTLEAEQIT